MNNMDKQAYDNCETFEKYAEAYTNSLLYFAGIEQEGIIKQVLLQNIEKMRQI